jgi:hypothetical protein
VFRLWAIKALFELLLLINGHFSSLGGKGPHLQTSEHRGRGSTTGCQVTEQLALRAYLLLLQGLAHLLGELLPSLQIVLALDLHEAC